MISVDPVSGGVIPASAVNTTKCLRYAAGQNAADTGGEVGAPAPGPGDATVRSRGVRRRLAVSGDPALDLSVCAALTTATVTNQAVVTLQVRVNALLDELPPSALTVANGAVASQTGRRLDGAFSVFDVSLRLSAPNTAVSVVVQQDALSSALGGQPSAKSNTLVIVQDTEPPRVSPCLQGRKSNLKSAAMEVLDSPPGAEPLLLPCSCSRP